ncbi:MAG TPA: hypothetical protein VMU94_13010 [Streptosporangiaceae bacterium]|nr:hypothetical protein [Streptosporangiaceae bacterium]
MAQWRIRVIVPAAPDGRQVLKSALAHVAVTESRLIPPSADTAETTGEVVVDLGEDDALHDLLRTLHEISPQVFISRVGSPEPDAGDLAIRVRKLSIPG